MIINGRIVLSTDPGIADVVSVLSYVFLIVEISVVACVFRTEPHHYIATSVSTWYINCKGLSLVDLIFLYTHTTEWMSTFRSLQLGSIQVNQTVIWVLTWRIVGYHWCAQCITVVDNQYL